MEIALMLVGGLLLLAGGGEATVRGAVAVARRLGMSELLIGLVLVGVGTSTPELLTSLNSAMAGSPGIALGNVVGSNISNVLLVFAIAAIVTPIPVEAASVRRDGLFMVFASVLLIAAATLLGGFTRPVGIGFLVILAGYLVLAWRLESQGGPAAELHKEEAEVLIEAPKPRDSLLFAIVLVAGGIAALVYGADLLVRAAVSLARTAGLSESVIGLTIVSVGTSLPELVATVAAAARGRPAVAFGNVVGSNIFNILGILGVTAVVAPIATPADIGLRDWGFLLGAAVLLTFHATTGGRVSRTEGFVLLAAYGAYLWLLLSAYL